MQDNGPEKLRVYRALVERPRFYGMYLESVITVLAVVAAGKMVFGYFVTFMLATVAVLIVRSEDKKPGFWWERLRHLFAENTFNPHRNL